MSPNEDKNGSYRLGLLCCLLIKLHSQGFKLRLSASIWKEVKKEKSLCYPTGISLLKVERCREKWALGTQHPADVTDVPLKTRGHSNKPGGKKKVHHWCVGPVKSCFQVTKQACFKSLKQFFFFPSA